MTTGVAAEMVSTRRSSAALCLLVLLLASHALLEARAAPSSSALSDYDTVRELYEMLMHRAAMEDAASRISAGGALLDHELVRKSTPNRSPSLRLRFGRRADPLMAMSPSYPADRPPQMELAEN